MVPFQSSTLVPMATGGLPVGGELIGLGLRAGSPLRAGRALGSGGLGPKWHHLAGSLAGHPPPPAAAAWL